MLNDVKKMHLNYDIISKFIEPKSTVLDLGCGKGELLDILIQQCECKCKGIEIDQQCVIESLEKGLSIIQSDLDEGLSGFVDKQMDYVILNQTLQSVTRPDFVIKEMLRVGRYAIVSFPNFGYIKLVLRLLIKGTMPKSGMLPFEWYDTPNIHLMTILDFNEFCRQREIKVLESIYLLHGKRLNIKNKYVANYLSDEAIFIIKRD